MSVRKRVGFFDLPAELRNNIYSLALSENAVYDINLSATAPYHTNEQYPGVLLVCKQVHTEAKPIFRFYNIFRVYDSGRVHDDAPQWLERFCAGPMKEMRVSTLHFRIKTTSQHCSCAGGEIRIEVRVGTRLTTIKRKPELHNIGCDRAAVVRSCFPLCRKVAQKIENARAESDLLDIKTFLYL